MANKIYNEEILNAVAQATVSFQSGVIDTSFMSALVVDVRASQIHTPSSSIWLVAGNPETNATIETPPDKLVGSLVLNANGRYVDFTAINSNGYIVYKDLPQFVRVFVGLNSVSTSNVTVTVYGWEH